MTLLQLLEKNDPSVISFERSNRPQRVRSLSASELKALDF
jgi:hypothetical protein